MRGRCCFLCALTFQIVVCVVAISWAKSSRAWGWAAGGGGYEGRPGYKRHSRSLLRWSCFGEVCVVCRRDRCGLLPSMSCPVVGGRFLSYAQLVPGRAPWSPLVWRPCPLKPFGLWERRRGHARHRATLGLQEWRWRRRPRTASPALAHFSSRPCARMCATHRARCI